MLATTRLRKSHMDKEKPKTPRIYQLAYLLFIQLGLYAIILYVF